MDIGAILLTAVTLIGAIAAIVQIVEYAQKRRKKERILLPFENEANFKNVMPTVKKVNHNLPPRGEFIGRLSEKSKVHQILNSRSHIICIDGIGGIGKTTLALEIAYECISTQYNDNLRFDGVIWVSCKNIAINLDFVTINIAKALDYPSIMDLESSLMIKTIYKLLSSKKILIILDNYEVETNNDENIIHFLHNIPEPSKVIITSREEIPHSTSMIALKGMSRNESLDLIKIEMERLGLSMKMDKKEEKLSKLFKITGGVPLAIKWSMGQIKQKGQSFDGVIKMLQNAKGDIFKEMFLNSWRLLTPHAHQILYLLSLLPSPITKQTLILTSNLHENDFDEAIGQLIEISLIETANEFDNIKHKFNIHQLTRFFVRSKTNTLHDIKLLLHTRTLKYYQSFVKDLLPLGLKGYLQIEEEKENLIYILNWGYINNWEDSNRLSLSLKWFFWEYGYWQEIVSLYNNGFKQAEINKDFLYMGRYLKEIAWVYCRQGNYSKTEEFLQQVIEFWRNVSPNILDVADLNSLRALIEKANGKVEVSKKLLQNALEDFLQVDEKRVEVLRIMSYIGELEKDYGDINEAKKWFSKTLKSAKELNQQAAQSWSLGNLGEVEFQLNNFNKAKELFREGLEISLQISRNHTIAECSFRLGVIAEIQNEIPEALNHYHLALDKYNRLGIEDKCETAKTAINKLESI